MRPTLRQLDIFRAIAQQGSTVSASVALVLSQSATIAALQELESALNVKLFDRVGKRLVLHVMEGLCYPKPFGYWSPPRR